MANEVIDYKTRIRQRQDNTALHRTVALSASPSVDVIRLDIVAQKVTIQLDSGLTASADGSIDGVQFFTLGSFSSGVLTYSTNLIKHVKITRSAGSGKATILAV